MDLDRRPRWIDNAWHEAYLEMCADPTDHRTLRQFAMDNKIDPGNLSRWRKANRNAIAYEVDRRRKEYVSEIRTMAWKALEKRMAKGSDKSIENCFKLIGDMVEKSKTEIDYRTPEDKRERVNQLLKDVLAKKASQVKAPEGADNTDA